MFPSQICHSHIPFDFLFLTHYPYQRNSIVIIMIVFTTVALTNLDYVSIKKNDYNIYMHIHVTQFKITGLKLKTSALGRKY